MADPTKYHYSNAFGVRFGDNDVALSFVIDENPEAPGTQVVEQATIMLTPRATKMLAIGLTKAIEAFEAANGEIPVPGGKIEALDAAIKAGTRTGQKEK